MWRWLSYLSNRCKHSEVFVSFEFFLRYACLDFIKTKIYVNFSKKLLRHSLLDALTTTSSTRRFNCRLLHRRVCISYFFIFSTTAFVGFYCLAFCFPMQSCISLLQFYFLISRETKKIRKPIGCRDYKFYFPSFRYILAKSIQKFNWEFTLALKKMNFRLPYFSCATNAVNGFIILSWKMPYFLWIILTQNEWIILTQFNDRNIEICRYCEKASSELSHDQISHTFSVRSSRSRSYLLSSWQNSVIKYTIK